MLRKFPDTVFLQQTDANLVYWGNLLAVFSINVLVDDACGERAP